MFAGISPVSPQSNATSVRSDRMPSSSSNHAAGIVPRRTLSDTMRSSRFDMPLHASGSCPSNRLPARLSDRRLVRHPRSSVGAPDSAFPASRRISSERSKDAKEHKGGTRPTRPLLSRLISSRFSRWRSGARTSATSMGASLEALKESFIRRILSSARRSNSMGSPAAHSRSRSSASSKTTRPPPLSSHSKWPCASSHTAIQSSRVPSKSGMCRQGASSQSPSHARLRNWSARTSASQSSSNPPAQWSAAREAPPQMAGDQSSSSCARTTVMSARTHARTRARKRAGASAGVGARERPGDAGAPRSGGASRASRAFAARVRRAEAREVEGSVIPPPRGSVDVARGGKCARGGARRGGVSRRRRRACRKRLGTGKRNGAS